jgi:hypothetical protein
MSEGDIRRHRRIPYTGPVRISWQTVDGLARYIQGNCLDVSQGGLRVQTPQPIPARTLVQINADRLKLSGSATVKHVERRDSQYILGLELNAAALERTLALATEAANRESADKVPL